jgi:hypothetical protein
VWVGPPTAPRRRPRETSPGRDLVAAVDFATPRSSYVVKSAERRNPVQYLALIYSDESVWATFSDEQRQAAYQEYFRFDDEGRKAGVVLSGNELDATSTATTVRVRDGETLVTDGPFAELKEALGGYYLLECGSIDEACEWAARIPGAAHGAVEVRPVYVDGEGGEAS